MSESALIKWLPLVVVGAGVVGSATTAQVLIGNNASEISDLSDSVEANEDDIELIQRRLIQRQGEVELRVQRIQTEQLSQGEDLEEILQLLKARNN